MRRRRTGPQRRRQAPDPSDERRVRRYLSSDSYAHFARAGVARRLPWLRGRELAGLARFSRALALIGRRFTPQGPFEQSWVHDREREWACRALRAAGTARAGLDNYRWGGRSARRSPCLPDLRTSTSRRERGNYPVVTPLLMNGTTGSLRGHPAVTVSSRTGVPPGRGRPPAQARGPVVLPTRPSRRVRGRRERGELTNGPAGAATGVRPGSGTARQPDAFLVRSTPRVSERDRTPRAST
jgi:hypothetical protein